MEIDTSTKTRGKLEADILAKTSDLSDLDQSLADLNREQSFDRTETERITARITLLDQELKNLSEERSSASDRLKKQTLLIENLDQEKSLVEKTVAEQEEGLDHLRQENERKRKRFFELRSEIGVAFLI